MKTLYGIVMVMLVSAVFVSCENEEQKMARRIKTLEAADTSTSPEYLNTLKKEYLAFYQAYPTHKKSAEFLYKAAEKAAFLDSLDESMSLLDTLIARFPKSEPARRGLFKKGITYENAGDCDNARKAYESFLEKYPKDPMSKDIRLNLKNLCKGIESFENVIVEDPDDDPPVK